MPFLKYLFIQAHKFAADNNDPFGNAFAAAFELLKAAKDSTILYRPEKVRLLIKHTS